MAEWLKALPCLGNMSQKPNEDSKPTLSAKYSIQAHDYMVFFVFKISLTSAALLIDEVLPHQPMRQWYSAHRSRCALNSRRQ